MTRAMSPFVDDPLTMRRAKEGYNTRLDSRLTFIFKMKININIVVPFVFSSFALSDNEKTNGARMR